MRRVISSAPKAVHYVEGPDRSTGTSSLDELWAGRQPAFAEWRGEVSKPISASGSRELELAGYERKSIPVANSLTKSTKLISLYKCEFRALGSVRL